MKEEDAAFHICVTGFCFLIMGVLIIVAAIVEAIT